MAKAGEKDIIESEEISETPGRAKKEKKKKDKGGVGAKIFIVIFALFIVAALVAIIGFNIFNLRDGYLMPAVSKIPVIGEFIEPTDDPTGYGSYSKEELIQKVTSLEIEIERERNLRTSAEDRISGYLTDIEDLTKTNSEIEERYEDFLREKDEFDDMITQNDPAAYSAFYESVNPENAEILYPQAKITAEREAELKKYLNLITATDETQAARILEQLIPTDLDLVVLVMRNINNETGGEILSAMSAENGAAVLKRMAPEQ